MIRLTMACLLAIPMCPATLAAHKASVLARPAYSRLFTLPHEAWQHVGHQTPAEAAQPNAACSQGGQQALAILDAAAHRLETARQTNSPAEMRAAVSDLQAALAAMRTQLAPCGSLKPGSGASGHEHHAPAGPGTAVTQPGSPAPASDAAQPKPPEVVDPVCAMKVDPKTAPKADYQGKTYYFCSESDRQLFLRDPGKYVKKE